MSVFVLVFVIVALSIAGFSIGLLFGRQPVQRTCGMNGCEKSIKCAGCTRIDTSEDNS